MEHIFVTAKLVKRAEHWKDQMVGWHKWRVVTRCPQTGKEVTEEVHGDYASVVESCVKYPECDCRD